MAATNPFEAGYQAAQVSKPWLPARERLVLKDRPKCPYSKGSIDEARWWNGFHAAQRELQDEPKQTLVDEYAQLTLFGNGG